MQLDPDSQIDSMGGVIPSENFDEIKDDLKQDNFNAKDASHAISLLKANVQEESKAKVETIDYSSNIVDKNALNFNTDSMSFSAPIELIKQVENDSYLSYLDEVKDYINLLNNEMHNMHKDFSNSKAPISKQSITNSLEAQISKITNIAINQGKVAYDALDLAIDNNTEINKNIDIETAIEQAKELNFVATEALNSSNNSFDDDDLFDNYEATSSLDNEFVSNELNDYVDSYDNLANNEFNASTDSLDALDNRESSASTNFVLDDAKDSLNKKESLHTTFNKAIKAAKVSTQKLYDIKCFDRFDSDGVFKPYKNDINEEFLNSLIDEYKDIANSNETCSYVLSNINYVKDDPFKYLDKNKDYSRKENLENNLYSIRSFDNYIENFDKEHNAKNSDAKNHTAINSATLNSLKEDVATSATTKSIDETLLASSIESNANNVIDTSIGQDNVYDESNSYINSEDNFDYVDYDSSESYSNYDDIDIVYDSNENQIVDGNPQNTFMPNNVDLQAMQRQDFYFKGKEQVSTDDFYYAVINKDPWYHDIYNANIEKDYILSLLEDSTRTYIDNDDSHWLLTTSTQYRNILNSKDALEDLERCFSTYLGKKIKIEFNFVNDKLQNTPKCYAESEYLAHIVNVRNKIKDNKYLRSFIEKVGNNVDNINIFLYKDIKKTK